ncbi:MAG: DUF2279 domain-containing protein [Spirosomataceae bacterium]
MTKQLFTTQVLKKQLFGCVKGLPMMEIGRQTLIQLRLFLAQMVVLVYCLLRPFGAKAQVNQTRLNGLIIGQGVVFAGGLYGLGKAWYKHPLKNFHTFNDNKEWLKIDKVGHSYTAYQIARLANSAYQWAGLTNQQSAVYASVSGLTFQMPIEILDGFSPDYGFSIGDMIANLTGPAILASQQLTWGEVRIAPKWSFHPTAFAKLRPELLGRNMSERWLKDYNGQTYWVSANVSSFTNPEAKGFPRLLSVAFGYSVENMVAADPEKSIALGHKPYKQFFISPDLDLTRIPTNSDAIRALLFLANCLKIPAPALEFRVENRPFRLKLKFHAIYF